jgi:RNA polymerase sigma factor for flagellar operon FliA
MKIPPATNAPAPTRRFFRSVPTRLSVGENGIVKTAAAMEVVDDSRDQRVVDHLHLVRPIARAARARTFRSGIELDDLVAHGTEGLLDAASRFDATRGVPFEAFARLRIQGAIVDGIRREGWFGRRAYRRLTAARVGIVDSAANDPRSAVLLPAGLTIVHAGPGGGAGGEDWSAEVAEGGEADNGARWNGRRMVPLPVEDDDALRARAAANLSLLPTRERRLLELRYYHGKTLSQAAGEMGFRRSWASRLHARALATLRAAMPAPLPYRHGNRSGNKRQPPSRPQNVSDSR